MAREEKGLDGGQWRRRLSARADRAGRSNRSRHRAQQQGDRFRRREKSGPPHFLIAVPQQMVNDYLICVGGLARRLNNEETRQALLEASTPAEFLERLRRDD